MTSAWDTTGRRTGVWDTAGRAVFGGTPKTRTDPATLTTVRQVADRCTWWRTSRTAGPTGYTIVTQHTVASPAKALRARWGVHGWAGADDGITGRAWLVVAGVPHPLTWGGQETITIGRLKHRTSDPLPETVQVEAGEVIYTVWEAAPGARYPSGEHAWDTVTSTRRFDSYAGGIPAMDSLLLAGAPQGIYGLTVPDAPAIACLGDSILESGWMRRAAHSTGAAWSDLSQWAEGTPYSPPLGGRLEANDPPLFTLGLCEYGTNDRGATAREAAEKLVAAWMWLTAGPVERLGQTTMVPYAAAGGNYVTLDGQTGTDQAWRDALNTWLRDGAPLINGAPALTGGAGAVRAGAPGHPLIGICDIAKNAEARNSRGELVWRVDKGAATSDGVHPTRVGADLLEPAARDWLQQHI